MAKIIGNTTATPTPQSDWNQTDKTKADYIKNKPKVDQTYSAESTNAQSGVAIAEALKGLSGAMHFKGVVASDPMLKDFDVTNYETGDVVIFGEKEYVFSEGAFVEFGDATSNASAISSLTNDLNTHKDDKNNPHQVTLEQLDDTASYVKMTPVERDKLENISEGAEVNVQSDWAQTDENADDYIKNKPDLSNVGRYTVVQTYAGLAELVNSNVTYEGIEVYVVENKKSYRFIDGEWEAIATESYVDNNLQDHMNNKENPHGVAASQVGAYTKEEIESILSGLEVEARYRIYGSQIDGSPDYTTTELPKTDDGKTDYSAWDNPFYVHDGSVALFSQKKDYLYDYDVPFSEALIYNILIDTTGTKYENSEAQFYFQIAVGCTGYEFSEDLFEAEGGVYVRTIATKYIDVKPTTRLNVPRLVGWREVVKSPALPEAGELFDEKADKKDVFDESEFKWTDYEWECVDNDRVGVDDDKISVAGTAEDIVIHCAGHTLGFTYSISGWSDASITINGVKSEHFYDYSNTETPNQDIATNIVVPLTYMESDIIIQGGMSYWTFTDMKKQSIKGMGDISSALDAILAIQDNLIGGETA